MLVHLLTFPYIPVFLSSLCCVFFPSFLFLQFLRFSLFAFLLFFSVRLSEAFYSNFLFLLSARIVWMAASDWSNRLKGQLSLASPFAYPVVIGRGEVSECLPLACGAGVALIGRVSCGVNWSAFPMIWLCFPPFTETFSSLFPCPHRPLKDFQKGSHALPFNWYVIFFCCFSRFLVSKCIISTF